MPTPYEVCLEARKRYAQENDQPFDEAAFKAGWEDAITQAVSIVLHL